MPGGETLIRAHMYRNARELWQGLSKNLVDTFGGIVRTLATVIGTPVVAWLPPVLMALALRQILVAPQPAAVAALVIAGMATAALLITLMGVAGYFHIPKCYAPMAPLGASLAAAIACIAVLWQTRSRVVWNGRTYRTHPNASAAGA